MKNLFIALIGLFVFIGCSKSFKEVEPEIEINKSNLGIMEKFDISPNDTSGLKIFGLAVKRDDDDTIVENPLKVVPLIHSNLTPVKFSHSPFCLFLFSSYSSCPLCRVLH